MVKTSKTAIGRKGEDLAVQFLLSKGFTVSERNYHTRYGEIDVIAEMADSIVFVEVKAANSSRFGDPETWVDERKQEKIALAAQAWLQLHNIDNRDCRFDIIAIIFTHSGHELKHIENAFWLE